MSLGDGQAPGCLQQCPLHGRAAPVLAEQPCSASLGLLLPHQSPAVANWLSPVVGGLVMSFPKYVSVNIANWTFSLCLKIPVPPGFCTTDVQIQLYSPLLWRFWVVLSMI